jgi:predicted HicB family RNase H-like nuclease
MALPYTTVLRPDDNDVIAPVDELPGCVGHGSDEASAIENLREMQRPWLQDCVENGHEVTTPAAESALPSGKWVQRVPRRLHARLVPMARHEKVSLNQVVTSLLSQAAGGGAWQQPVAISPTRRAREAAPPRPRGFSRKNGARRPQVQGGQ